MSSNAIKKAEFARNLAEAGYEDFLVLDRQELEQVLTPKRTELLDVIEERSPDSITELAEHVERDVGRVHRDLDLLFRYSLVEFEESDGKKAPRQKHEHVFAEPLL